MNSSRTSRTFVLLFIAGLHVALLAYAMLSPRFTKVTPPEPPVLMAQIIPEPVIQPPTPPKAPPAPPTPKPKPVIVKPPTPPTPVKTVVKTRTETPVKITEDAAPALPPRADATPPAPPVPTPPAAPAPAPAPAPVAAVTPPRFNAAYLNNPPPNYPPLARRMGDEGKVLLRVYVTPDGAAGEVRVLTTSGSPMFDEAAVAAVKQWRFVPAKQGDSPVAAWVQVPIVFKLG